MPGIMPISNAINIVIAFPFEKLFKATSTPSIMASFMRSVTQVVAVASWSALIVALRLFTAV